MSIPPKPQQGTFGGLEARVWRIGVAIGLLVRNAAFDRTADGFMCFLAGLVILQF